MNPLSNELNRRTFLKTSAHGFGALGLGSLLAKDDGMLIGTHHKPRAKRIIYMFQSGAPSQMDLFDPKPDLGERFSEDLPDSIRMGQRIT